MSRRQQFRASQTAARSGKSTDPLSLLHSFDASLNPTRPAKSSPLGASTVAGLPLELVDRLKAFPLFSAAPDTFLLSIGSKLRPSIFEAGREIIREGEDARAMYWLVRGSVKVTSRDGESTHAELKPGSFFGEIGILMDMPRTASIVASIRSLVVRLNKEDLQTELPRYPDVESAIREEALERLAILEQKKKQRKGGLSPSTAPMDQGIGAMRPAAAPRKRSRDTVAGDVEMGEAGVIADGEVLSNKRRKSPSPGIAEVAASSALGNASLTVRQLLKELPLFSGLPNNILHFLGKNAQPVSFEPFTDILKQGSAGREVYFIIKGDVEVLTTAPDSRRGSATDNEHDTADHEQRHIVRARLKPGQYFGEVTSLSLAPRRTATVRSVDAVECLLITGEVLDELWNKCSPELRRQVESEAKRRLELARHDSGDTVMTDADSVGPAQDGELAQSGKIADGEPLDDNWRKALPTVRFDNLPDLPGSPNDATSPLQSPQELSPLDPDPYFSAALDNMRTKSRRSSLAPPLSSQEADGLGIAVHAQGQHGGVLDGSGTSSPPTLKYLSSTSPLRPKSGSRASSAPSTPTSPRRSPMGTRRSSIDHRSKDVGNGRVPDQVLVRVARYLDVAELMKLRRVSVRWMNILTKSPEVLHDLDLSLYNKRVTDEVLKDVIVPFAGTRPRRIDLSNCFHVTDDGFKALVESCGEGARTWRMKSVWDVSGPAVLQLVEKAKCLEEIDLSNCRKVGDNLLARVVGWVVPEGHGSKHTTNMAPVNGKRPSSRRNGGSTSNASQHADTPSPGTIIGASRLKRLTLSYCKHVQDRSMAHIAVHASDRLESLDLTRCTSISDHGFHSWASQTFTNLKRLVLADCTYLSDQAIVGVVGGCKQLQHLDLSFCCALSDTASEVLALGLPDLRSLNMAFCGSAISDNSMRCMGLHLLELRYLSVRGCVRVTGQGVESVIHGCRHLEEFDVSQCKNLRPWLDRGGVNKVSLMKARVGLAPVKFDTVADGTWRTAR